ncbi:BfmA/BtgA family mobilization protein [Zunongwangia profunda]|uniref:BfmA/BtgA family mobilization protein n=1 Tax=Zunongwangia profunda TaxID=398743 RepID=UPI00248F0D3F|nr:BfmA/BtgA family mobilization protein [Zunongwangia profunda]|tara:strand:+ start:2657 stop:3130 length:474 start_codon:yes stop_codon:yes gene_type:complete
MQNKSIQIQEKYHKDLKNIAKGFNQSYGKLVEKMILYFKRTGINPDDLKNESPTHRIQQLDNRLVSFLRVQERDILNPLRQETYEYSQAHIKALDDTYQKLYGNLAQIDKNSNIRTTRILDELEKQREALTIICEYLDPKNKKGLITTFQNIFKNAD